MSKEKKVYKLERRDGPICGICKRDITLELELLHAMYRYRRTLPLEREALGLKRVPRRKINLNLDHIIPISRGGTNDLSNLVIAHKTCNDQKRDMLLDELYEAAPSLLGKVPA